MVKRTAVVLGILSVVLAAGIANAWVYGSNTGDYAWEWDFYMVPDFCPVPCPEPCDTEIVKEWSLKVVGPCPAPFGGGFGGPYAPWARNYALGWMGRLVGGVATPCEYLFGGTDGVYGCSGSVYVQGMSPCSFCCGGLPGALASIVRAPTNLW